MNEMKMLWHGFAASIPGSGHIRRGIPCQDASAALLDEYPAVIVCDGRGSASRSELGAQGAIEAFQRQTAILAPFLASILDKPDATQEMWEKFSRILYRTLMQVKLDLAKEHSCPENEFDFTVALAVAGREKIGCFQVGDGALVVKESDTVRCVFLPDKGEFANQTHFLRNGGETRGDFHSELLSAENISGIAATSDGPEHLMFQLASMTPGKIFEHLFNDLAENELCRQDLMDYLTRQEWNKDPRGADDRSIAIIGRNADTVTSDDPPQDTEDDIDSQIVANEDEAIIEKIEDEETDDSAEVEKPSPPKTENEAKAGENQSLFNASKTSSSLVLSIVCSTLTFIVVCGEGFVYHRLGSIQEEIAIQQKTMAEYTLKLDRLINENAVRETKPDSVKQSLIP